MRLRTTASTGRAVPGKQVPVPPRVLDRDAADRDLRAAEQGGSTVTGATTPGTCTGWGAGTLRLQRSASHRVRTRRPPTTRTDRGLAVAGLVISLVHLVLLPVLPAVAIPVFLNQRDKAVEVALRSDLSVAAITMETARVDLGTYPLTLTPAQPARPRRPTTLGPRTWARTRSACARTPRTRCSTGTSSGPRARDASPRESPRCP